MTEPKRATWGDFLRWVAAERGGRCPGPTYGLDAAAEYAASEREAVAALLGLGVRDTDAEELKIEWVVSRGGGM